MPRVVKKLLCGFLKSLMLSVDQREHRHQHLRQGHIWVCVGKGSSTPARFELDANLLNHPLFEDLLQLSEDEFGYSYGGALRIPCDADSFLRRLRLLGGGREYPSVHYMELANYLVASSGETSIHRRDIRSSC